MKKILLLISIVFIQLFSFSQQAKGFVIKDSKSNKKIYIKQGAEIVVFSDSEKEKAIVDSISNQKIYTPNKIFNFEKVDYIKYKDKYQIKIWRNVFLYTLATSLLLVFGGFILEFAFSFFLTSSGYIGLFMLIPLLILLLFVLNGKKIWFK